MKNKSAKASLGEVKSLNEKSAPASEEERELYFLVCHFLGGGPCSSAANILKKELVENDLLPSKRNWKGEPVPVSYEEMVEENRHIESHHLFNLCEKLKGLVDKDCPGPLESHSSTTLLGKYGNSLLRKSKGESDIRRNLAKGVFGGASCKAGAKKKMLMKSPSVMLCRELGMGNVEAVVRKKCKLFEKFSPAYSILGHKDAPYCFTFDQTGDLFITGADDFLIKVWNTHEGSLIGTLRGHRSVISDIAVSYCNRFLATAGNDRIIRIWSLTTLEPLAVLSGHECTSLTSVHFSPAINGPFQFVLSTGNDGTCRLWKYDGEKAKFSTKPIVFDARSLNKDAALCSAFSPSGNYFVCGSNDNIVRFYDISPGPPVCTSLLLGHTEQITSIFYSNKGDRFATGSWDGTAKVWHKEKGKWFVLDIDMRMRLVDGKEEMSTITAKQARVLMMSFSNEDKFLLTCVRDGTIRVWDSFTGKLLNVLVGHKSEEIYCLGCHPHEKSVIFSAGLDGQVIIWDFYKGEILNSFHSSDENVIPTIPFVEGTWSPDGLSFAVTDGAGTIHMYSFDKSVNRDAPKEQFFQTDYSPFILDAQLNVLDESTQQPPHLLTPQILVNANGGSLDAVYQSADSVRQCMRKACCGLQKGEISMLEATRKAVGDIESGECKVIGNYEHYLPACAHGLGEDIVENGKTFTVATSSKKTGPRKGRRRKNEIASEQMQIEKVEQIEPAIASLPSSPDCSEDEDEDWTAQSSSDEDSSEDFSDFSDDSSSNGGEETTRKSSPSKRGKQRRVKQLSYAEDSDDDGRRDGGSHSQFDYLQNLRDKKLVKCPSTSGRAKKKAEKRTSRLQRANEDVRNWNEYVPHEWVLRETQEGQPFVPQIGDEVVYILEAHKFYVKHSKIPMKERKLPWCIDDLELKEVENCKVIDVKYFKFPKSPLTYANVKLEVPDKDDWEVKKTKSKKGKEKMVSRKPSTSSGKSFCVIYNDEENVPGFMVDRFKYDMSVEYPWKVGLRVKSFMDGNWHCGVLKSLDANVLSTFNCFKIKWDDGGSVECISPWEIESTESQITHCPISAYNEMLGAYDDLIEFVECLQDEPCAAPFVGPVDGSMYETYYMVISYPMDLGKILRRLKNRYYRSKASILFDIRHISRNACMYNESDSIISVWAQFVSSVLEEAALGNAKRPFNEYIKEKSTHIDAYFADAQAVEESISYEEDSSLDGEDEEEGDLIVKSKCKKKRRVVDDSSDEEVNIDVEKVELKNDIKSESLGSEESLSKNSVEEDNPPKRKRGRGRPPKASASKKMKCEDRKGKAPISSVLRRSNSSTTRTSLRKRTEVVNAPSVRRSQRVKEPSSTCKDNESSDKSCDFDPESENLDLAL
eukprot:Nk52_evm17s1129 gene=Nk52_evmTU17s1129